MSVRALAKDGNSQRVEFPVPVLVAMGAVAARRGGTRLVDAAATSFNTRPQRRLTSVIAGFFPEVRDLI